jgi:transposase
MTLEGSTDTESFRAHVGQVLVPTLRPGDIVVMDNLTPHKNDQTLALIAQAGAEVLFLPACSPDLNPMEKMWSKVESHLRSAEARTQETLINAIGAALRTITPQDAINWFASCGYSFI